MFFASDNAGPAHPDVLQGVITANTGYANAYGNDDIMTEVRARLREIFEAPEACVHLVATGTAANVLGLATLTQPWETILCTPLSHIQNDECNAPEFFSGGSKLTLVGDADKMTASELAQTMGALEYLGVHGAQRGPVSITQVTEMGRVYSVEEITEISKVAHSFDKPVHMDGARFANALAALGCSPAEMTWKAGVDAVSFGGTKNGCMGVEAVIFFDPKYGHEFELRRKRGAHLFSKHRYLSAQMLPYLTGDLWLRNARSANAAARRLSEGLCLLPGVSFLAEPQANMIFFTAPRALHKRLLEGGAKYHLLSGSLEGAADEPLDARLVCDWSSSVEGVDAFLSLASS